MKHFFLFFGLILAGSLKAQINESFSDGNFTQNPKWIGSQSSWIVNNQFQLQSEDSILNNVFYLTTENTKALNTSWTFTCQLNFNPSGLNYADIYLISLDSNLMAGGNTGYFVRVGNTNDEVALYRKDVVGVVKIIDGANGLLNNSTNLVNIKVERSDSSKWSLYYTINNNPEQFAGCYFDSTYLQSDYFGILIKQSTSSFFKKHIFDNILVSTIVRDTIAPALDSVDLVDSQHLDLFFNELLSAQSCSNVLYYNVDNGVGPPVIAVLDSSNPKCIHLSFLQTFPSRTPLTISVNGISDLSSNVMIPESKSFSYYTSSLYDIVIDEIMADPTPVLSFPDVEWIELRNISPFEINLRNWKVGKQNTISGGLPDYVLKPDSMVVISSTSGAQQMKAYAPSLGVALFPTLTNSGDLIFLQDAYGKTIHAINYNESWYQNALKEQGGWSLEMIDLNVPCSGEENWIASKSLLGATPGKINSQDAMNINITIPKLLNAFAKDSLHILLTFNETIDSLEASHAYNYNIDNNIGIPLSSKPIAPFFNEVLLTLSQPLTIHNSYLITLTQIKDCVGNVIDSSEHLKIAMSQESDSLDLVINEILFNPPVNGVDFVEIYNRSKKPINLHEISIANRNTFGQIDNIVKLIDYDLIIFPEDYFVFTPNVSVTLNNYLSYQPSHVLSHYNLPSYNDDQGSVVILNTSGKIIDEVNYREEWHFALLENNEGVSIERVNPEGTSQSSDNWHSAASSVGYATPAYRNSQFLNVNTIDGVIVVTPKIISPDNDGNDDVAQINYKFSTPGFFANVVVFDINGKRIKVLQKNALCGTNGYFLWNGLDENNQQVPLGIYVLYVEALNDKGVVKKFKQTIVISR